MSDLLILTPDQKRAFDEDGFLLLEGFYNSREMEEMRRRFHELVTVTEGRPQNMRYSFMEVPEGYQPDPFNPKKCRRYDGSDAGR